MATGVQPGNSFTLPDQIVNDGGGGGGPVTHTYTQDEGLYIITGQCTFNAGGHHELVAKPGAFVSVPRLTEHSFTVDDPETQILNFSLPAGWEQLLIGIAYPAERNEPPPPNSPMAPPHLVDKLAADHGQISVLGQPFKDSPDPEKMRGLWTVLASGQQTGNSHCLLERLLPQGPAAAPHLFVDRDEIYYILDGQGTFLLGDRIETSEKGALIFIPRGTVHCFRVDTPTMLIFHLHTPVGFERLLPCLGQPATDRSLPPSDLTAHDVNGEIVAMIMSEIGMRNRFM
ncbi:MAG: hypothetical protein M1816_004260 [Peltula sp. TS41687]|nr:MAG: hypothetical protein M1816_004260 [Peltula sp. TS41687]